MFEVSWSELLILGVVTLIFVGPKDLPRFMATLGRYAGVVRRHANEFRAVFEQAMREAEMDEIQKELRGVKDGVKASLDEAVRSVDSVREAAKIEAAKPAAEVAPALEAAAQDAAPDPIPMLAPEPLAELPAPAAETSAHSASETKTGTS